MNKNLKREVNTNPSCSEPSVSVLLPVYNGGTFVQKTIDSILKQSFADFELIIINDGSTDNTKEILNNLTDRRVRVVHKNNEGIGATLNKGLQMARGKYIAQIDADDLAHPDRLEMQVKFLQENPGISVVGTATKVVYPDGVEQVRRRPLSPVEVKKHVIKICPVVHPSVMMRKDSVLAVGGYDVNYDGSRGKRMGMDYHLWIRMISKGYKISNLPEPLVIHYKSKRSVTGSKSLRFKLLARVRLRLWAKKELGLGFKAYFEILFVAIFTVFHHFGVKADGLFNFLSK